MVKRPKPKRLAPGVQERYPFWPKFRTGMAVVAGTWYGTSAIAASYAHGQTLPSLAKAYELKVSQIEDALRYELRQRAAN